MNAWFTLQEFGAAKRIQYHLGPKDIGLWPHAEATGGARVSEKTRLYLAVIAVCLAISGFFVWRLTRPAAPVDVRLDLPMPQAGEELATPQLFDRPPAENAVKAIIAGDPPRAQLADHSGQLIWVRPGETFLNGKVEAITTDAVVWQGPKGTILLKAPEAVTREN